MAKRNKLEIIKDILVIIKDNNNLIKSTPLLRKSNISSSRFKGYFQELREKNFIKLIQKTDGKFVSLTGKGFRFIEKYQTIINFIDEFEL
jgi:predicted transcriptional regulator